MRAAARALNSLRSLIVPLTLLLWLTASATEANGRDFMPRLALFEGAMELGLSHEEFENRTNGRGIGTDDTMTTERLKLGTVGYVYHPRFITYKLKGAWGLRQEQFDSDASSPVRTGRSTAEYDLHAWILPEHPYNLEVFTARRNPLLLGRLAPGTSTVSYEKGAVARYLRMPWSLEAGVTDASTSGQHTFGYDSRSTYASGTSFLGFMTTTVSYFRVGTTQQGGLVENTRYRYYLNNQLNLPLFNLNTRLERHDEDQGGLAATPARNERTSWNEDLTVPLPYNFQAGASYSRDNNWTTSFPPAPRLPEESFARNESERFTLKHDLYASLRTSYNLQYTNVDSTTGNSDSKFESINTIYTKLIPGGRLTAGGTLSRNEQSRRGAPIILREPHQLIVPGSFFLGGTRIDPSSITVWVQLPSGTLVLLDPVNYLVQQAGPRFEIFILNLPPPFAAGVSYPFRVDYAMITADAELLNRQIAFNLGLQLFENRVNPYYSHSKSDQEVTGGTLPGGPDSTTSDTVGLQLMLTPVSLLGEYVNYRSLTSPFETWRASADYARQLHLTTTVTARVFHSRTVYAETSLGAAAYSDELTETALGIQKDLPEKRLNLSASTAYAYRRTFATTHAYTANAIVLWRMGRVEARAGASTAYSSSDFLLGHQRAKTNYYYATITRHLF